MVRGRRARTGESFGVIAKRFGITPYQARTIIRYEGKYKGVHTETPPEGATRQTDKQVRIRREKFQGQWQHSPIEKSLDSPLPSGHGEWTASHYDYVREQNRLKAPMLEYRLSEAGYKLVPEWRFNSFPRMFNHHFDDDEYAGERRQVEIGLSEFNQIPSEYFFPESYER